MISNILLIFIFWTFPCAIYLIAPFGAPPTSKMIWVMFITNILLYAPILLWKIFHKNSKTKIIHTSFSSKFVFYSQLLILSLNIYIIQATGFVLGIIDDSIRTTVYETAGYLWSLTVALYSISYVALGVNISANFCNKKTIFLGIVNLLIFVSYGMKAGIVQIALSYLAGKLLYTSTTSIQKIYIKLFGASILILTGFWIINSMRAKENLTLDDFIELLYLYISPNFSNFSNISSTYFSYEYMLGGVFGGIYKAIIPGYYDPLTLLSQEYLEYQTWNVWSYLSTFYVSGGITEVMAGTFLIGIYTTASLIFYKKRPGIISSVNLSQMLLLLLFLHNQFYYSSFAPYLAIGLSIILSKFIYPRRYLKIKSFKYFHHNKNSTQKP